MTYSSMMNTTLIATIAFMTQSIAAAAPLIEASVSEANGQFLYEYTLVNDSSQTIVGFELSSAAGIVDVVVPSPSWDFMQFEETIQFFLFDDDGGVTVGQSLSGFQFASPYSPGQISYSLISDPPSNLDGSTIGPTNLVPEPHAFVLFALGLCCLVVFVVFRKRHGRALR